MQQRQLSWSWLTTHLLYKTIKPSWKATDWVWKEKRPSTSQGIKKDHHCCAYPTKISIFFKHQRLSQDKTILPPSSTPVVKRTETGPGARSKQNMSVMTNRWSPHRCVLDVTSEDGGDKEREVQNEDKSWRDGTGRIIVPKIKVKIEGKNDKEKVIALIGAPLDSGHNQSYCTQRLANQLQEVSIFIGTIKKEGNKIWIEETDLKMTSVGVRKRKSIIIPKTAVTAELQLSLKTVTANNRDIMWWKHLWDTALRWTLDRVDLLTGLDAPVAQTPLEQRTREER